MSSYLKSLLVFCSFFFLSLSLNAVDTDVIIGKVVCGYQGWFNCYNDGSPVDSWRHRAIGQYQSNTPNPSPNYVSFEIYSDISIYPPAVLHQTALANFPDGRAAELFSSYPEATIDMHFELMAKHNIDAAALQRFISETFNPVFK